MVGFHLIISTIKHKRFKHQLKERFDQKQDLTTCCLQETHFKYKDIDRLRGQSKIYHANRYQKRAGISILIKDKVDLRKKNVTRD